MPPATKAAATKKTSPAAKVAATAKKTAPATQAAAPATNADPVKSAPQVTVTLKQIAAELAEGHDLPNKKAESILGDLALRRFKWIPRGPPGARQSGR